MTARTPTSLFTGDDYQLLAEASYREEDRRELFHKLHGVAAPADDQLARLADLAQRIAIYLRRLDQGLGDSRLDEQPIGRSVSPADRAIIGACLHAAAHGPFFDEGEFHTLFGLERHEVAAVAARWPDVDLGGENSQLAIHNSLGQLLGYPHGRDRDWSHWVPGSRSEVESVFQRWRSYGW